MPEEVASAALDLHSIVPQNFDYQRLLVLLAQPVGLQHTRIGCGSHRIADSFVGETSCLLSIAVL